MSTSQQAWLIVSFDINQESNQLVWLPIVNPEQTTLERPGGIYQWIGPQASRILLQPHDTFSIVVLSLCKLPPLGSVDTLELPYAVKLNTCCLQFSSPKLLSGSPFSYEHRTHEITSWRMLEGPAKEHLQADLERLAIATRVAGPLNARWQISTCALPVLERKQSIVWNLDLTLSAHIKSGDLPPQDRTFTFDPECQVGTGTG